MTWDDIKYYPLTIALFVALLFTACSIVLVVGKANVVTTEQTDDPNTDVSIDSVNVINTEHTKTMKP